MEVDTVLNVVELHVEELVRRGQHIRTIKTSDSTARSIHITLHEVVIVEVVEGDVVPDHATSCIVRLDAKQSASKSAGVWGIPTAPFFKVIARITNVVSLTNNQSTLNDVDARAVNANSIVGKACVVNDEVVATAPNAMISALVRSELDHNGIVRSDTLNDILKRSQINSAWVSEIVGQDHVDVSWSVSRELSVSLIVDLTVIKEQARVRV